MNGAPLAANGGRLLVFAQVDSRSLCMISANHVENTATPLLKQLIGEDEVAAILGVSRRHVTNLRQRRIIPFYRLGRAIRFSPEAVSEALKRSQVEARA